MPFLIWIFVTPRGAYADGSVGPTDLIARVLDALQASP
jgi:hypothetical protein